MNAIPQQFVVAGASMKSLRTRLKPALPRTKKQGASCRVVITTTATSVTFSVTGAAISMPATTSGPFIAEVPYEYFKHVLEVTYKVGDKVVFGLAAGSFSVNGVAIESPQIIVGPSRSSPEAARPPVVPPPAIADPSAAPLGLPLLAAYVYIRKYGLQRTTDSAVFASQQVEVDALLDRAGRLLRPVGITRADLEHLIDKKLGLA